MSDDAVKEELLLRRVSSASSMTSIRHVRANSKNWSVAPPSPIDHSEAKRIKLHKLALKDRMESIIRSHALQAAG